ncbi:efflux RND transporter periplasmic adaptor subunit [Saccharicrinis sp. 156]|uniref:efflux RND transporter periplasmic adaptor subunit n=1 Tax=Saccharicrinis sp. 156 TaxID=3417574 RepID=UPI003D337EBF
MKKILTILLLAMILASCAKPEKDQIKAKIKENIKTIQKLKKENEKLEKDLLKFTDEQPKHKVPVITREVKPKVFNHYIEANGLLEAEEIAIISSEVPAQVKTIHVKEGQKVNQGDMLVSLNSNVLGNAIREIETNLDLATITYNKQKNLWEQNIGSEMEYLQAKAQKESLESSLKSQKEQLKLYNITAPFSGSVDDIIIKEGELASPGMTPILQLVNLNSMKVNADVSEVYLPSIHKGDTILLSFPTYPDMVIKTPVHRTGNVVHPDNRTFNVQLVLNNIDNKLKPNMMATLKINDFSMNNALTVPSAIIKNDITGQFLFVVEDGKAKKVYVETGRSYMDETVVTNGLMGGEQVIVAGYNTVSNGALVAQK